MHKPRSVFLQLLFTLAALLYCASMLLAGEPLSNVSYCLDWCDA